MLTHSIKNTQRYRFLTIAVVIALACSVIPPTSWGSWSGAGIARAAGAGELAAKRSAGLR